MRFIPKEKNELNKWKNHFIEMKGDVGMSVHEKEGKQVNATPTHKTIYNPIPTSLCSFNINMYNHLKSKFELGTLLVIMQLLGHTFHYTTYTII